MSDDWRRAQLSDVLVESREKVRVERAASYPVAGVKIAGGGLFWREVLSGAATNYGALYRLREGQLVYRKLTAWEGPITVVPPEFDGAYVSSEFPTFTLDRSKLLPEFMSLVCELQSLRVDMRALSTGTAERRNRLSPADLLKIEIDLPPLAVQVRIADAVRTFRRASAASRRRAAAADRLAHTMYRRLVRDGQTQSLLFEDFVARSIEQVVIEPSAEYRVAGVAIAGGGLFWRPMMRGEETRYPKMHRLRAGALVYRKLTAWEGPIAVVPDEFDGAVVSPEFPTFALDEGAVDLRFMTFLCRSAALHAEMRARSTGTAERRNRLKPEDLLHVPVELPALEQQSRIGALERVSQALKAKASALDVASAAYRQQVFAEEPSSEEADSAEAVAL